MSQPPIKGRLPSPSTFPSIAFPAGTRKKFGCKFTRVFLDIDDASEVRKQEIREIRKKVKIGLQKEGYFTSSFSFAGYVDEGALSEDYMSRCLDDLFPMEVAPKGDVDARLELMFLDILQLTGNQLNQCGSPMNMLIISNKFEERIKGTKYATYMQHSRLENLNVGIVDLDTYLKEEDSNAEAIST